MDGAPVRLWTWWCIGNFDVLSALESVTSAEFVLLCRSSYLRHPSNPPIVHLKPGQTGIPQGFGKVGSAVQGSDDACCQCVDRWHHPVCRSTLS